MRTVDCHYFYYREKRLRLLRIFSFKKIKFEFVLKGFDQETPFEKTTVRDVSNILN